MKSLFGVFALVALALVLHDTPAHACAPAPPAGLTVRVAGEEALIVWDAEHGVEHFVRRAQFDTTAAKFGFLVPTPSTPRLGEVDASIFDTLLRVTAPPVVMRDERTFEPGCLCDFLMRSEGLAGVKSAATEEAVRVLSMQTVAGYDAVVLEADDAAALAKWLADNGYDARASLLEWLTPYVAEKWKLTAFKLAKAESAGLGVQSAVVRMTFNTPAPFFPYREPSDQRAPSPDKSERLLRVYTFSTTGRMAGTLGKAGVWPGIASYAKPADGVVLGAVTQAIPDYAAPPVGGWLTRFDDTSSPRPGTDEVYFATAPSLGELAPPPNVVVIPHPVRIPVDLIALVLFAGGVAMVAIRRLRRT